MTTKDNSLVLSKEVNPETIIVSFEVGISYPIETLKEIRKSFKRFPMSAHTISLMKFKSINYLVYNLF